MRWARAARWWVPLGVLSVLAHLWRLDDRPLAHDEAIDAWFSWQARGWGVMRYDPTYHGPLRFYLEGPVLAHVGIGAGPARLVAAVAGIVATLVVAGSHRLLGRVGAPVAALLVTLSPTFLTVTRTGREDSLTALVSLALLLLVALALVEPQPWHVIASGALLAASFALKETTFLFGLSAATFVAAGAVLAWRRDGRCRAAVRRLGQLGSAPWMWGLAAFGLVFMVVFTSGFRYPAGLESGLLDGVRYWWGQHDVRRGGQPWFFYLAIYAAYEWLLIALALVGGVAAVRCRSLVGSWFAWMAVVQAGLYAWAGEKFAWLAIHPLVPAALLAGLGAQAVADRVRARAPRRALVGLGAAALVLTMVIAVPPAITDGADPRELLVTVQTSDDVPDIAARLRAGVSSGDIDGILVDDSGGGSWPWAWYLHQVPGVAFRPVDQRAIPTDYDAVILLARPEPPPVPPGFTAQRFRLRVWWVPDYSGASVGDLLRWFATREVWSPTASSDQYLLVRDGA